MNQIPPNSPFSVRQTNHVLQVAAKQGDLNVVVFVCFYFSFSFGNNLILNPLQNRHFSHQEKKGYLDAFLSLLFFVSVFIGITYGGEVLDPFFFLQFLGSFKN